MKLPRPPARFAAALLVAAAAAHADPSPERAAYCVAALKVRADPLADRLRAGEESVEAPLLVIVTASFAFIGSAYKQGLRSERADELVKAAEKAQAKLPPAEMTRAQDACQAEGQKLYADANYIERLLVRRAASNRIERLRRSS